MQKRRPKHLDLINIRLPIPGFVSILHRVSGALLFLCIPFLLYLFQSSLGSAGVFAEFKSVVANPLVKLILLGLLWAFLHHFCAGIRFLALDLDYGTALEQARLTSKIVLGVSIVLTLAIGVALW